MKKAEGLYGIAAVTAFVLMFQINPSAAFAQDSNGGNPMLFSPDSQPYGMAYGEWTAEWWKWFISMPTDENPINDPTGELCASNQSGSVWFLVGSGGGEAERSCDIPAGKAILIPAINIECSRAEDDSLKTEEDLRACASSDQDLVSDVWATVDGVELADEQVYRVDSPMFEFAFPPDNVFSAPEGPTQAVSDGFWVFIRPLPPGEHDIHVGGLLADYTVTAPITFVEDSTYHLSVQAPASFSTKTETATIDDEPVSFSIGSSSVISEIAFEEAAKQISFMISDDEEGITTISIGSLLEGPYTVMVDGEPVSDYGVYEDPETGETTITMAYRNGTHETVITGTNVVPEFPLSIILLVTASMGAFLFISRIRPNLF